MFWTWISCMRWMGASTVKWTDLDPYLVLVESDSKLYNNFEFGERKKKKKKTKQTNKQTCKEHINLQIWEIFIDKDKSKKSLHILEDGASGVQVGDIKQVTI